jgi:hypothetical protein
MPPYGSHDVRRIDLRGFHNEIHGASLPDKERALESIFACAFARDFLIAVTPTDLLHPHTKTRSVETLRVSVNE